MKLSKGISSSSSSQSLEAVAAALLLHARKYSSQLKGANVFICLFLYNGRQQRPKRSGGWLSSSVAFAISIYKLKKGVSGNKFHSAVIRCGTLHTVFNYQNAITINCILESLAFSLSLPPPGHCDMMFKLFPCRHPLWVGNYNCNNANSLFGD